MGELKYFLLTFLFIFLGPLLLLLDIVLDIYTAVSFYREEAYVYLNILLLILVFSSVVAQFYSWELYSYEDFKSCLSQNKLTLLHVFQLGSFFRWYDSVSVATKSFTSFDPKRITEHLSHYLGALRLIETISKSIPQLVLMLTITLRQGHLDTITVLKALGSASVIAINVTMYHHSMRSFLLGMKEQPPSSSAVYFLWNFLFISSRLTALALLASIQPYFIVTYFVCMGIILFFAHTSNTVSVESICRQWFYRPLEGLRLYLNWLTVGEGRTRWGTVLYYWSTFDTPVFCTLWCWKISTEPPYFEIPQLYAIITAACVVSVYILCLLIGEVCNKYYHPNQIAARPHHQHLLKAQ